MQKMNAQLPYISTDLSNLQKEVDQSELALPVRKGCEAKIVWHDEAQPQKTEYAVVYLHGFSATHEEGNPAHYQLAEALNANLYLSRLSDHGLDTQEPLLKTTANQLLTDAQYALAIGKRIGKKVILVGTSTGGTLALQLASVHSDIAALVLYSPNIQIADQTSKLLNNPWGLQIARQVFGGNYRSYEAPPPLNHFWHTHYRLEALVELEELVEKTMTTTTFEQVKQPVFLGYYYKDEEHQDDVVSVAAMQDMFAALGTPPEMKEEVAFSTVGDHVICSKHKSNDYAVVVNRTLEFLERILPKQKP